MNCSSRRSFLQLASAAVAATMVPPAWSSDKATRIGAELFTLRNEVQADLPGTMAAVKKIGFQTVETFPPMHQRPAAELRKIIEDAGLTIPSAHFAYDTLEASIEYAHELGVSYMVCAMLPKMYWTREGFEKAAVNFNAVGAKAKAANIELAFHNHNFEFQPLPPAGQRVEGTATTSTDDTGLKILLENTSPKLVFWEEDCYWVAQGGQSPLALLEQFKKRTPLLHFKDRKADAPVTYTTGKGSQFFTEIGTGTIDWRPIVKVAQSSGAHIFIEQDTTAIPPLESLAISYRNLQKYLA